VLAILCAGRVVGVINLSHRMSYRHTNDKYDCSRTLGFLVGAEIERAKVGVGKHATYERLETRKAVDRAKSLLNETCHSMKRCLPDDAARESARRKRCGDR